jgi:hypothetical protein
MGVARHLGPAAAHQEVKVATLICLQHMIDIQLTITAHQQLLWRLQISHARRQFGIRNIQMQTPAGAIEFDPVAFAHHRQGPPARASGATCSTTVP